MKNKRIQVGSDYPAQLQVGTQIFSQSGFLIGVITEVIDEPDFMGDDGARYTDDRDYLGIGL